MKWFTLATVAGVVMLSGCASTSTDGETAKYEEKYVPLGTIIARKEPNRADSTRTIDRQALENERAMNSATK